MSEATMSKSEFDSQAVLIERAIPEDAEAVSDLLRRTWMATYPNAEAGITEEDIRLRTEERMANVSRRTLRIGVKGLRLTMGRVLFL
ncbi:hypothetical protein IPF89_02410 [Candidatus Saccharibacteria bacterium]|nr:MAG: hypothetical protein IPF89_02410 [Candidatus Saccharibacteria bacterium]